MTFEEVLDQAIAMAAEQEKLAAGAAGKSTDDLKEVQAAAANLDRRRKRLRRVCRKLRQRRVEARTVAGLITPTSRRCTRWKKLRACTSSRWSWSTDKPCRSC